MQDRIGTRIALALIAVAGLGYGCNQDKPTYDGTEIECRGCEQFAIVCEGTPVRTECVPSIEDATVKFNCPPTETKDCSPGGEGSGGAS